jgi:hypothetical protein
LGQAVHEVVVPEQELQDGAAIDASVVDQVWEPEQVGISKQDEPER